MEEYQFITPRHGDIRDMVRYTIANDFALLLPGCPIEGYALWTVPEKERNDYYDNFDEAYNSMLYLMNDNEESYPERAFWLWDERVGRETAYQAPCYAAIGASVRKWIDDENYDTSPSPLLDAMLAVENGGY